MTARIPDAAAIRAAVQRAADDPDPPRAPPFAAPSGGGKSVLLLDTSCPAFPRVDPRLFGPRLKPGGRVVECVQSLDLAEWGERTDGGSPDA